MFEFSHAPLNDGQNQCLMGPTQVPALTWGQRIKSKDEILRKPPQMCV